MTPNCVNHHADADRLVMWINDRKRQPAITAFTEGPERQVAYAIESALAYKSAAVLEEVYAIVEDAFGICPECATAERIDEKIVALRNGGSKA